MGNKIGVIDISRLNNPPEKHELATAKYFSEMGKDITFIEPSNIPQVHRPDIQMDGIEWEIKAPVGKSKRTIEQNFRQAIKQSQSIIFDLRRINVPETECLKQLERHFKTRSDIKRLWIIKINGELVKYSKNG